jgi:hypothetical protein
MANYRSLHTKFWSDPDFETLAYSARYLFIYLLTNEHRNEAGVYTLSTRKMAFEAGMAEQQVREELAALTHAGKVSYDLDTATVWVCNAVRYQTTSPNTTKAIARDLEWCQSPKIKAAFLARYGAELGLTAPSEPLGSPSQAPSEPLPSSSNGATKPPYRDRDRDRVLEEKENTGTTRVRARKTSDATPATSEEVFALFEERGYLRPATEAGKFFDFYTANGWRVGKNPMKDWRAAAANWNRTAKERATSPGSGSFRTTNNGDGPGPRGDVFNVRK